MVSLLKSFLSCLPQPPVCALSPHSFPCSLVPLLSLPPPLCLPVSLSHSLCPFYLLFPPPAIFSPMFLLPWEFKCHFDQSKHTSGRSREDSPIASLSHEDVFERQLEEKRQIDMKTENTFLMGEIWGKLRLNQKARVLEWWWLCECADFSLD